MRLFYAETLELQDECESPIFIYWPDHSVNGRPQPLPGDIIQRGNCMNEITSLEAVIDLERYMELVALNREKFPDAEMFKGVLREISGSRQNIIDASEMSDKKYYEAVVEETTIISEDVEAMEFLFA